MEEVGRPHPQPLPSAGQLRGSPCPDLLGPPLVARVAGLTGCAARVPSLHSGCTSHHSWCSRTRKARQLWACGLEYRGLGEYSTRLLLLLCFYSSTSSRRISVYQLFLARYHFETNLGQVFPQSNRKPWQMLTIRRTHTLFLLPSPPDLKSFQLPSSVRVVAGVAPARTSELSVTLTLVRSCECQ